MPLHQVAESLHRFKSKAVGMERLREFLHGVAGHGAGKYFAQLDGDNPVVLDGGHRSQSGVFLQLGNLLIQRGVAVVVDDDDFRGALHNALPTVAQVVSRSLKMLVPPACSMSLEVKLLPQV